MSPKTIEIIKNVVEIVALSAGLILTIKAFLMYVLKPLRVGKESVKIIANLKEENKNLKAAHESAAREIGDDHRKEILDLYSTNNDLNAKIRDEQSRILDLKYDNKVLQTRVLESPEKTRNLIKTKLIQEEKIVYVKYLYITPKTKEPVYVKKLEHLNESVTVYSEHLYYRFNKFNKSENSITITDSSAEGVVDLNIIFPWLGKIMHTSKTDIKKDIVTKTLRDSDSYLTLTSYYNGFIEDQEDIAMRLEFDTISARLIVDFSSIPNHEKLFVKPPDGIIAKYRNDPNPITYVGLKPLRSGIYILEHENLKADSIMMLDFHVDWEYLDK